jgi:hypothetical protein
MTTGIANNWPNLNVTGRVDLDALTVGGVEIVSPLSGYSGYSGMNGTATASGYSGYSGVSGATGAVGISAGTPASAAATGTAGTVLWDADYIYVCTATDTWKRVAIATWA